MKLVTNIREEFRVPVKQPPDTACPDFVRYKSELRQFVLVVDLNFQINPPADGGGSFQIVAEWQPLP